MYGPKRYEAKHAKVVSTAVIKEEEITEDTPEVQEEATEQPEPEEMSKEEEITEELAEQLEEANKETKSFLNRMFSKNKDES
jgi:acyl-CoA thioesterase